MMKIILTMTSMTRKKKKKKITMNTIVNTTKWLADILQEKNEFQVPQEIKGRT